MIYTFYSYKGGVGRSMALANIAECFCEKHLRVLMVDWDLEAPGLEVYFLPAAADGSSDSRLQQSRRQPGLIDMLYEYKRAYPRFAEQRATASVRAGDMPRPVDSHRGQEELARATEAVTKQLQDIEIPEALRKSALQTLHAEAAARTPEPVRDLPEFLDRLYGSNPLSKDGMGELAQSPLARYIQRVDNHEGLYLMGAGSRGPDAFRNYATAVQDFDWAEFYAVFEGRQYFEWLRARFSDIADVVLIDSRTGVTEMGGVCTRQMPDAVVSFCAPNWQNVEGVVRIVAGLNEESLRQARDNREVDTLVVPTRIDDAESGLLHEFRERFIQTAEKDSIPQQFAKLENPLWNLQVPYIPRYNYREQRVIGPNSANADPPTERLIAAYRKIAVHLAVLAGRNEAEAKVRQAFNAEIATQFSHLGPSQPPRLAPYPPVGYVSRSECEERLRSLLTQGARSALWGRAGTGKTSLAAQVVNEPEIQERFPDGTVWLSRDRMWTAEAVAAFFRSSFGLPSNYRESAISDFLEKRRFLVVIDDVREQSSIDRIMSLGRRSAYLLVTRDLALASRFTRNIVSVADFTPSESLGVMGGADPTNLLISESDASTLSSLVPAFGLWPAGAAAIRASYEIAVARGETAESAWRGMAQKFRDSGTSILDALPAAGQGERVAQTIRDAIAQLEPEEKRRLVAAAQHVGAEAPTSGPEAAASLRRLSDYGLLDKDGSVPPIVCLWLIYSGDLADPGAHARSEPEPGSARQRLKVDKARAQEILRGAAASMDEIRGLGERLKNARYFSLARRLLGRATRMPELGKVTERARLKVIQQYALCTYRDPELPAGERYSRAIEILETADLSATEPSQETLGLAGAAFKNLWRQGGQRSDLEVSFSYYERGAKGELTWDYGYTRINAAFVLDLLAHQEAKESPATSDARRAYARRLRQEIVDRLPGIAAKPEHSFLRGEWWYFATMAEACFGLGAYEASRFWLRSGLALSVPDWEKESTTRQLADLASAQDLGVAEQSEEWRTLRVLAGDAVPALRALTLGKVGLALSGGGFRASLFHIGVLAKLAEADVLRHVEVLSCVSGGSIVGAHLYLELRHLLQTKADHEITREDYIAIVRRMQREFLAGVQMNLRTMLFRSWGANLRTLFQPGYTRTHELGSLFERYIYSRAGDGQVGPRYLSDLLIRPLGASPDFNPKLDNWRRSARVPILLLNATTLNTGHNWQFAATWMGEPPPGPSSVDSNDVLRRMYYEDEAPAPYRKVPLGLAVAASACVPALFDPVEMADLYPGRTVRLVDGGVHDNQGTSGLLEQECRVMLVSDASGHMNSERSPGAEITTVPMRSNSILMARVREAQFRQLESLKRSSALTGLLSLHLKKDLNVNHVDWVNCQDPYEASDEARTADRRLVLTSYGMPRNVQELLAGIRTDLDSFSDAEAYALMLSGYRMAEGDLKRALPSLALDATGGERWDFLEIERALSPKADLEGEQDRTLRILRAARSRGFKVWNLSITAVFTGCVLLVAAGFGIWLAISSGWLTSAVLWVPPAFAAAVLALWAGHRAAGSRKSLTVLSTGALMVTVGWVIAAFHLAIFDPMYQRYGRVPVSGRTDSVRRDPVSVVIVLVVLLAVLVGTGALAYRRYVSDARSLAARAYSERQAGQLDPALRDYSAALKLGVTPQLLRDRAYVYKLQGRLPEAKQDLENALELGPNISVVGDLGHIDSLIKAKSSPAPAQTRSSNGQDGPAGKNVEFPVQAWCYQEAASATTRRLGLHGGYGAYCHQSQSDCEAATAGSRTASRCAFIPRLDLGAWGGVKPIPGGYRGSWFRHNMAQPLPAPFPQPPTVK